MKFHWQRAKKRSRKVLLMMKKVMSQLLCLQRETTSVRDVIEMPSINTTDVLANGTQSIPGTGEDISEDNHNNEGSYDLVSGTKKQTDGGNEIVPQVQGADVGNELCVEEIGKECANVTTDTTEQRVGDDVKSSCAGRCDHTQNDDSAIDNKDSTNECETKFICQSFNNCGCKACVKEATNNAVINDNYQIRGENEGSSEDSDLLKKASEIVSFRKLHSDVEEKLTNLCHVWEQKSPILSIPEDRKEEVLGQIRTTVCQAQLLMRQKLKQYIGLVGQAEHGGGEQPTKVEDLQGFWDMVYFQVEEMMKKFQELEDLEKNNWNAMSELQSFPKKGKKSLPSAKMPSTAAEISEKQLAAREKREAARLKIKELRAMAVNKKVQNSAIDTVDMCSSGANAPSGDSNVVPQSELSNCDTKVPTTADLAHSVSALKNNENKSECGHTLRLESASSLQISTTSSPLTSEN